jgi:hypothetical protein
MTRTACRSKHQSWPAGGIWLALSVALKKEGAEVFNETEGQGSGKDPERAAAKNPPAWGAEAKVRANCSLLTPTLAPPTLA